MPVRPSRDAAPAPATEASSTAASGGANLRELIAILGKRKRSVILATLLTTGLACAYLMIATTTYTSTTSILIDARTRTPLGVEPTAAVGNAPDTALIESQVRVIASDTVLRRVVEKEGLADEPARAGLLGSLIASLTGRGETAPAGREDRVARALAALTRNVIVKRSERTYVIDVDVSAADAQKAARLANAVASAYIEDQAEAKAQAAARDSATLNLRLADLGKRLAEAENRLTLYKQKNQIFDANGKRISEQELGEGATALAVARTKTADAKARYDQIQRIIASGRPADAVPEALKSGLIDRLRGQYADIARQEATYATTLGARHPALIETQNQLRQVQSLIGDELKRIAAGAANDYQVARANEASVDKQVEALKSVSTVASRASVELREREHDVDSNRIVYDKFLRARETVGESGLDGPVARVIAPAIVPLAASAPKTLTILGLALASGLFGGIGHAFWREYLDEGARMTIAVAQAPAPERPAPADTKARNWLPKWLRRRTAMEAAVLTGSAVPQPAAHTAAGSAPVAATQVQPQQEVLPQPAKTPDHAATLLYAELSADAQVWRGNNPLTLLVTALEARSGKTGIAMDLARAAAATGARVLLMDASEHAPALAGFIPAGTQPDLIDLMGTMRLCYDLPDNISVVPIMEGEDMIVRRLMRRAANRVIDGITGHFDVVVVDGGTIGDGGSLQLMAQAADSIVLASRRPRLTRMQIEQAMADLDVPRHRYGGMIAGLAEKSAA